MNIDLVALPSSHAEPIAPYESGSTSPDSPVTEPLHNAEPTDDVVIGVLEVLESGEQNGAGECDRGCRKTETNSISEISQAPASPTSSDHMVSNVRPPLAKVALDPNPTNTDLLAALQCMHLSLERLIMNNVGTVANERYRRNPAFPPQQWGHKANDPPGQARRGGRGKNHRRTPVNYDYQEESKYDGRE